jgi:hypothetical protein
MANKKLLKKMLSAGSALIIAVILTSLLAIIGVMFIMVARVDKMATSSISLNKELNFAVDAVIAKISQELVSDVPGVAGAEYYDYPGNEDKWLASLEPYDDSGTYKWRRISDIYNRLDANNLKAGIIPDYQQNITEDVNADADGDGVADSKWVELEDVNSNKGKPIYAAVRIVDNGAMINANTAYKFDPTETDPNLIDGSSQTQIDLFALAQRSSSNTISQLDDARFGKEPLPHLLKNYIRDVVWRYNEPNGLYTPLDISDELEIRNRFTLNRTNVDSRLENLWKSAFKSGDMDNYLSTPVTAGSYSEWLEEVLWSDPAKYSYRHFGTIYNMDRIITPDCSKMANINAADVNALYKSIRKGLLDTNYPDANGVAAQIAVNLKDYADSDSNVAFFTPDVNSPTYYGFEQPCIYISEFAQRFLIRPDAHEPPYPTELNYYTSYAIELYKPYAGDNDPCNWRLVVGSTTIPINNWNAGEQYCVIYKEDTQVPLDINTGAGTAKQLAAFSLLAGPVVSLQRPVPGGGYITVDSNEVPGGWFNLTNSDPRSIQRDITLHKCIRHLWAGTSGVSTPTLGRYNSYFNSDSVLIQAHPEDKPFTNTGEIGMLFRKSAYSQGPYPVGPNDTEATARINLADPNFQQLFKYLTVFDPNADGIDNDGDGTPDNGEWKVPGRININTAPWFVLAQLPWVSQRTGGYNDANLAQAIVAYRDKLNLSPAGPDYSGTNGRETGTGLVGVGLREEPGFASIGELATVVNNSGKNNYSMDYYALGYGDLTGFPDLTPDSAPDDFEQRDVIFSRISNLVTVRSDVFTAYILVRIGKDGPQKRVIAILDRSNVYLLPTDKVRVIALYPVPDPR